MISKSELIKVPWFQKPVHVIGGYLCLKNNFTSQRESNDDQKGQIRRKTINNNLKNENELINESFLG